MKITESDRDVASLFSYEKSTSAYEAGVLLTQVVRLLELGLVKVTSIVNGVPRYTRVRGRK